MPDTEHDPDPVRPPHNFVRTPWWRWNLVTLAGGLFVLAWTREILQLSFDTTTVMAVAFAVLWYLGPCVVIGTAPWPLSRGVSMPKRLGTRAVACRIAAGMLLALGVIGLFPVASFMASTIMATGMGLTNTQTWIYMAQAAIPAATYLAAAIGLWTLAGVCSTVQELRDELRREDR